MLAGRPQACRLSPVGWIGRVNDAFTDTFTDESSGLTEFHCRSPGALQKPDMGGDSAQARLGRHAIEKV